MATTKRNKLNLLYSRLAPGTPVTSEDLAAMEISADLAVHYVRAGWLQRLARGVYYRPNDPPTLHPSLVLLQRSFDGLQLAASLRSTGTASVTTWRSALSSISTAGRPGACLCGSPNGFRRSTSQARCIPCTSANHRHVRLPNTKKAHSANKAGIKANFHDLRRTGAEYMRAAGVPIDVYSKQLGHSDIKTTQIYMGDLSPEQLAGSAIQRDAWLEAVTAKIEQEIAEEEAARSKPTKNRTPGVEKKRKRSR